MELARFEDVLGLKFQHFCLLKSKDVGPSKESDHDNYHDDQDSYDDRLLNNYILVVNKYGLLILKKNNKLEFYKIDKLLDVESFTGGKGDQLLYSLEFGKEDSVLNIKYKDNNSNNTNSNTNNTSNNTNNKDNNNKDKDNTDNLLLVETKYYIYVYNILNMKYDYIYNKKVVNTKYHYELVNSRYMLVLYNDCVKVLELDTDKENNMNLSKSIKMVSNFNNKCKNLMLVDNKNNLYVLNVDFENKNKFNLVELKYDLSQLSDLPPIDNVNVVGCYGQNNLIILSLLLNNMDLLILFCKNEDNNTNSNNNNNKDNNSNNKNTSLEILGYCYNELYLMLDDEEEYYGDEEDNSNKEENKENKDNRSKEVWVRVKYVDEWNLFVIYSNKSTSTLLVTYNNSLIKANNGTDEDNNNTENTNSNNNSNKENTDEMLYNNHILLMSEGYNLESNEYGNNVLNVEFYYNYETEVYRKNSLADTPTLKNPIVALLVLQSGEVLLYFVDSCYVDNTNKEVRVLPDINGNRNKENKENNKKNYNKLMNKLEEYRLKSEGKNKKKEKNINNYYYGDDEDNKNKEENKENTNNRNKENNNRDNKDNKEEEKDEETKLSELIDKYYKLGYSNYRNDAKSFKLFETLANCLHQFNSSVYSSDLDNNNKDSNTNNTSNKEVNNKNKNNNTDAFSISFDNFSLKYSFSDNFSKKTPVNSLFSTGNTSGTNTFSNTSSNNTSSSMFRSNTSSNSNTSNTSNKEEDELDVEKVKKNTKKLDDYVMIINKLLKIQNNLLETTNNTSKQVMNNDNLFINLLNNIPDGGELNDDAVQEIISEYLKKYNNTNNNNNNKNTQIIEELKNKLAYIVSTCGLFPVNITSNTNNTSNKEENNTNSNKENNNKNKENTSRDNKNNDWKLQVSMEELPEVEETMLSINTSLTNLLKRFEGLKSRLDLCYQNYLHKKIVMGQRKYNDYYKDNEEEYYGDREEKIKEEERKRDFEVLERKLNEVISSLMNLYSYPSVSQSANQVMNKDNLLFNTNNNKNNNNNFNNFSFTSNNTSSNNTSSSMFGSNTSSNIFSWSNNNSKLDQQSLPLKYNNYKKLFPTDKDVIATKHDLLPLEEQKSATVGKSLVEDDSLFKNLSSMGFGKENKLVTESKEIKTVEKDKETKEKEEVKINIENKEMKEEKKDSIFSFGSKDTSSDNTLTSMFSSSAISNTGTTAFGVTTTTTTLETGTVKPTVNTLFSAANTSDSQSQVKFGDTNTKLVGYDLRDKGNVSETSFFSTINTSKSLFDIALNNNTSFGNTGFGGLGSGFTSGFGTATTTPVNSLFSTTNTGGTNAFGTAGFGGMSNTVSTGGFTGANCFTPNSFSGSFNPAPPVGVSMGMNTNAPGPANTSTNASDFWTSSRRSNPLD